MQPLQPVCIPGMTSRSVSLTRRLGRPRVPLAVCAPVVACRSNNVTKVRTSDSKHALHLILLRHSRRKLDAFKILTFVFPSRNQVVAGYNQPVGCRSD